MIAKRCFDALAAAVLLVLLGPVMLLIAVVVAFRIGHPVLFVQSRPGLHGRAFRMYKFRTMTDARGEDGELLADAERLTPLGRFLRSTSLDELPELWNVLRGDMSLVGPRPLLMEYLPLYSDEQARRHELRPGITGWAQVQGRNSLSWPEKFSMDVWYVDNHSFVLDLRILLMTVRNIARREGISHGDEATMPKFRGNR